MTMSRQMFWKAACGIILTMLSLSLLVWAGHRSWYTDQLRVSPPHYCPKPTQPQLNEGFVSPGHTAIIIDVSNFVTAKDAELAFQKISDWTRDSTRFLQKLSIYGLPESANSQLPDKHSFWCVPKIGDNANRLYENPVYVEAQFQKFLLTLQDEFQKLVDRQEADQSPIVETIAGLVESEEEVFDSILLVSDMLQHTSLWSHYTMEGDTLSTPPECGRITGPERLKTVYVYYINRELAKIQAPEWPDEWWRRCLSGVKTEMLNLRSATTSTG